MSPMQQPKHVAALQAEGASQKPPAVLQTCPGKQSAHCWPLVPQKSSFVARMQVSPAQQPAQLAGPHVSSGAQNPPGSQRSLGPHWSQRWPKRPQKVLVEPERHCPVAVQQPAQLLALQEDTPSQRPPPVLVTRQTWPAPQRPHWPPFSPQATVELPGRHRSPTQQPSQFEASHRVVPQVRVDRSHARPSSSQFWQLEPPRPHAVLSVPLRHWRLPASSTPQHPAQEAAPHDGSLRPQTRALVQVSKPAATQSVHAPPIEPHERTFRPV